MRQGIVVLTGTQTRQLFFRMLAKFKELFYPTWNKITSSSVATGSSTVIILNMRVKQVFYNEDRKNLTNVLLSLSEPAKSTKFSFDVV